MSNSAWFLSSPWSMSLVSLYLQTRIWPQPQIIFTFIPNSSQRTWSMNSLPALALESSAVFFQSVFTLVSKNEFWWITLPLSLLILKYFHRNHLEKSQVCLGTSKQRHKSMAFKLNVVLHIALYIFSISINSFNFVDMFIILKAIFLNDIGWLTDIVLGYL